MLSMSWTSSSTLSVVLETRHRESPDCLRSSCTPSTLQIEAKGSNLCVETFQPSREKIELTQKSTCLASVSLDRQRKSSTYADHINFKRDDPIFQIAKETLRKAVTDAMEPKGNTLCLKILASLEDGSYTARYESSSNALSESGTCLSKLYSHQRGALCSSVSLGNVLSESIQEGERSDTRALQGNPFRLPSWWLQRVPDLVQGHPNSATTQ